jgi:CheY-like chemotaxis protein
MRNQLYNETPHFKLQPTLPRKALLVEDNEIIQEIHRQYLIRLGYQVDLAENGQQAITLSIALNYDLMLLDLGLPDIMGEIVLEIVRLQEVAGSKRLPIIVVTAHEDKAKLEECRNKGADRAVQKPLTYAQLTQLIKEVTQAGIHLI